MKTIRDEGPGSMTIELGDVARDTVTGFEGVVICRTKWLHGCERMTLQPKKLREGKPIDMQTFDLPTLVLVKKAVHGTTGNTGGPRPEPKRARAPR